MSDQFGRKGSLLLGNGAGYFDVSNLRFTFEVRSSDNETPNTATIRIFNLSKYSREKAIAEYTTVTLQAGYDNGNYSIVFQGDIKQFNKGNQTNVDSFLEILAADGDSLYNFGTVNVTLAAGTSLNDRYVALCNEVSVTPDPNAINALSGTGGILPRGKTLFGMFRVLMGEIAKTANARWSIQNGVVTIIPNIGYLPGEALQINSGTGLLSIPTATDNGIMVQTLLNPLIKIGTLVQINEKDINSSIIRSRFYPNYASITYVADVTSDGFYRVMVAEHTGDTRGEGSNTWVTELTVLNVNPDAHTVKGF